MPVFIQYNDETLYYHHTRDEKPNPADFTMHNHSRYEIYYFISGKASFFIEGNKYPLCSGDLLIMRSTEAHCISVDPREPYERFALHFARELMCGIDGGEQLLSPFENREAGKRNLFGKHDFKDGMYKSLLENIMNFSPPDIRMQTLSNLPGLLNEIRVAFEKGNTGEQPENSSPAHEIISYINAHLNERISLDGLCGRFYISKAQLCRIFRKTTGTTVYGYITAKRLSAAQELLLSGISAEKVFTDCGFGDYSSFYRAYCKHFGFSPSRTGEVLTNKILMKKQ